MFGLQTNCALSITMMIDNIVLCRTFPDYLSGQTTSLVSAPDGTFTAVASSDGRILLIDNGGYSPSKYMTFWPSKHASFLSWIGTNLVFVTSRGSTAAISVGEGPADVSQPRSAQAFLFPP